MRRLTLPAMALVGLLTACVSGPEKTSPPKGLTFACAGGGEATLLFLDGGYLPDQTAMGKDHWDLDQDGDKAEMVSVPRSAAKLIYQQVEHKLVADWIEQGLRYRSYEPQDGKYLVWTLDGEQAFLEWRPDEARSPVDAAATGQGALVCTRNRTAAPPAPRPEGDGGKAGHGKAQHDTGEGEPHRR